MTTVAVAALVREAGGGPALAEVSLAAPGEHEIVVRVRASGVCPTDLFGIDGGAGDRFPAVFGHEGAGVVEAVGRSVTAFAPGDHVALGFASCGDCDACRDGHPAYCDRFAALNYAARPGAAGAAGEPVTTGWMGQSAWATHVVVDEGSAVAIGEDVPWPVAATLGCGVLTGAGAVFNVLRPGPDDGLLVIGAGTTGLAAVMAAAHRGVARIVVSDPLAERRALALELGASAALAPGDLAAALAGAPPFTHALDTVGSEPAIDAALTALAPRGVVATVALKPGSNRIAVSQTRLLWGRTLTGVIEGDAEVARDVPMLAALWRAGRLPVERLITLYAFDDVETAVADARDGRVIKPVLEMPGGMGSAAVDSETTRSERFGSAPVGSAIDDRDGAREPARSATRSRTGELLADLLAGRVAADDLPRIWRSLPAVDPAELRGLWRGSGLSDDHAAHRMLVRSRWYGKLFRSADDVAPIVCETDDGALVVDAALARGGASLSRAEHDGLSTAAMGYDGQPIVDLFVRIGPGAVLGVMTGRHALDDGRAYYFVLERVADREVRAEAREP
ncbi:alcohol dehydrogenase catalytic domain-containing protein [Agromyces sp. NPDC058104]|uniref:alcohol dehydrogenase catalytic domain-containing protein n=1 Tax=Agromyces sp. NPDC058104 TaxID=3346342 RepID=UPI0036DE1F58